MRRPWGAAALAGVVGQLAGQARDREDRRALRRIDGERECALARYRCRRDVDALDLAIRELDRQEAYARRPRNEDGVPAELAVRYLQQLPETWRLAGAGPGRRQLASALFERIEVLGLREATVYLTSEAARHEFAAALPQEVEISVSGRGERS